MGYALGCIESALRGQRMIIKSFRIKNFKGIRNCRLELGSASNPIITLIGLNESGKTTILEALTNFIGEDQDLLSVVGAHRPKSVVKDFIPKHLKANFSDQIELEGTVSFDEEDKTALADIWTVSSFLRLRWQR